VILIVGVISTLSISGLKSINTSTKLTLENLKDYLLEMSSNTTNAIICLDDCSSCSIYIDNKEVENSKIENFIDKSIKTYRYDFSLGMVELDKKNDICFSYSVDAKGVGEQIFVEYKHKAYDFSTYLTPVKVYVSLEELQDEKEKFIQEVLR